MRQREERVHPGPHGMGGWPLPSTRRSENKHHHQDKEFNEKFIINYIGQWTEELGICQASFLPARFFLPYQRHPHPINLYPPFDTLTMHYLLSEYYYLCCTASYYYYYPITGSHSLSPSCNLTPPLNCRGESAKDKNGDSQQFPSISDHDLWWLMIWLGYTDDVCSPNIVTMFDGWIKGEMTSIILLWCYNKFPIERRLFAVLVAAGEEGGMRILSGR